MHRFLPCLSVLFSKVRYIILFIIFQLFLPSFKLKSLSKHIKSIQMHANTKIYVLYKNMKTLIYDWQLPKHYKRCDQLFQEAVERFARLQALLSTGVRKTEECLRSFLRNWVFPWVWTSDFKKTFVSVSKDICYALEMIILPVSGENVCYDTSDALEIMGAGS